MTNPATMLHLQVYDFDYIGAHDFLGQLKLRVGDYLDGKEVIQIHQLRGEIYDDPDEDFDR